jgi:hypothetical protein
MQIVRTTLIGTSSKHNVSPTRSASLTVTLAERRLGMTNTIAPRVGQRVTLLLTSDPYTNLRAGDSGVVVRIDALGTIHVEWDSGSTLGLIPGVDKWMLE